MVSSPWKGPQVSDGFTLSEQSSGVSRMLLSGGLLGSRALSWPLGQAYSPPGAKPCPAPSGGVPIALPSTEEHLGMAGWEKQAHTSGCHATCGDWQRAALPCLGQCPQLGTAPHSPVQGVGLSAPCGLAGTHDQMM